MAPGQSPGRFLADAVCALDLEAAVSSYGEMDGRGMSAYAPATMARVLLYGQAGGVYSSRRIQARTYDDVALRCLSADEHPDPQHAGGVPQAALAGLGWVVYTGLAVVRQGWPGEARPAFEEASTIAIKEAVAWQVQQAMLKDDIVKVEMARRMQTSRAALDRLFDLGNGAVTLQTLSRAASAIGRGLRIELV
ncbi:MAG: transposase [Acidobacteriaceae bacterium]